MKGVVLDEDRAWCMFCPARRLRCSAAPQRHRLACAGGLRQRVRGRVCVQGGAMATPRGRLASKATKAAAFRVALAVERNGSDHQRTPENASSGPCGAARAATLAVVLQVSYHMVRLPSVWGWSIRHKPEPSSAGAGAATKDYTHQGPLNKLGYLDEPGLLERVWCTWCKACTAGLGRGSYAAIEPLLPKSQAHPTGGWTRWGRTRS